VNCYLDSSVLLRYLLGNDRDFEEVAKFEKVGSSELLLIECRRVIHRYRMQNMVDDGQLADLLQRLDRVIRNIHLIEISAAVKYSAAGPFPTVIGSLEAIHLASALEWRDMETEDDIILYSLNKQMRLCARALGFTVQPAC